MKKVERPLSLSCILHRPRFDLTIQQKMMRKSRQASAFHLQAGPKREARLYSPPIPSNAAAPLLLDPLTTVTSSSDASSSLLPTRKMDRRFFPLPFDLPLLRFAAREVEAVPVEAGDDGSGEWSRDCAPERTGRPPEFGAGEDPPGVDAAVEPARTAEAREPVSVMQRVSTCQKLIG